MSVKCIGCEGSAAFFLLRSLAIFWFWLVRI